MISLGLLAATLLGCSLLCGWALAVIARRLGSSRARLITGGLAVLEIQVLCLIVIIVGALLPVSPKSLGAALLLAIAMLFAQGCIIFVRLRRRFDLSFSRTWVLFVAYAILAVLQVGFAAGVLKPYLFEAFEVPGHAMTPTLEPGDRLLVNKLLRPRRWDLVGYWHKGDYPAVYCQRLVGFPGERLRFEHGVVYVNAQEAAAPPVVHGHYRAAPAEVPSEMARYQDGATISLGSGEYFFLADNLDHSLDSRVWGPAAETALVGVFDLRYWPLGRLRVFR